MDHEAQSQRERVFSWQKDQSIYQSLDADKAEFRVLALHAGTAEDPVSVELRHERLDETSTLQYETVSYHWGDTTETATIEVNKQHVSVHANAASALRRIRTADSDRMIWLDAVCINQADPDERAQQVAIMADIYSSSKGNLVYLGNGNEFTLRAIDSISKCLEDLKQLSENPEGTPSQWWDAIRRFTGYREESIDAEALASFFSNPWFS